MHIQIFKYFRLLSKYCQLNRSMSAGEKTGPNFRANDHVLNFHKFRQNSQWQVVFMACAKQKTF